MQEEVIKKLKELSEGLRDVKEKKKDAVKSQKYEIAASYRDTERSIMERISSTINIKESDFESKELFYAVERDIYEVIGFIEEGDTNLTPALIRKLTLDAKVAKKGAEELKKMMSWTHVYDERPELKEEVERDGKSWLQSDEVIVLYVRDSGEYDVCIGRYIIEKIGVHDKRYSFITRNPKDSVNLSDVKGWQSLSGEAKGWIKIPEKKI
jgi:hypothetical protein